MHDWVFYLWMYPDLFIRLPHTRNDASVHFHLFGDKEGRSHDVQTFLRSVCGSDSDALASILQDWSRQAVFDPAFYHRVHPDLVPLQPSDMEYHYQEYGYKEDRSACLMGFLFHRILGIRDRQTQAWILQECFDFDWDMVEERCGSSVSRHLSSIVTRMGAKMEEFPRPPLSVIQKSRMTVDSLVPVDIDWQDYRSRHITDCP